MKNAALASVPKHIEHFSKFSPSPLSMKQFLDFGEYRPVFRWTIFDVNAGGAGADVAAGRSTPLVINAVQFIPNKSRANCK